MRSQHSIIPFLLRLAVFFTILCLIVIALAFAIGSTIRGQTISVVPIDPFSSFQGNGLLHLMDIRVGLIKQVSDIHAYCCTVWSPDGNRIAFTSYNDQPFFWDMRDGTTQSLAPTGFRVFTSAWSPDGKAIVAWGYGTEEAGYDLYVLNPDENTQMRLTFLGGASSYDPSWSLDSRYIIFHSFDAMWTSKYYRIEPDGENIEELMLFDNRGFAAQFSPDRSQIVYLSEVNDNRELYMMKADGSEHMRLTWTEDAENPALWSPDGTRLLFQSYNEDYSSRRLEVMNVDGTERRKLAEPISLIGSLSWSPDGWQILYESQEKGKAGLYVMNADGSNIRLLVLNQGYFYSDWQPQP